jgi:AraC family transcriptional regulator
MKRNKGSDSAAGSRARLKYAGGKAISILACVFPPRTPRPRRSNCRAASVGWLRTFQPGSGTCIELTEYARSWIERIWAPLRKDGYRLLDTSPTRHLTLVATLLRQASEVQESRTRKLRHWMEAPSSPARQPHLRGGLSPAALRRVQVFVEANLAQSIHLNDLAARAALSPYHFARAFKRSAGMTPRVFIEQRRIERAKQSLASSTRGLAEIATETGFNTQSRLTTTFKRRTGITPAVYRRGHMTHDEG